MQSGENAGKAILRSRPHTCHFHISRFMGNPTKGLVENVIVTQVGRLERQMDVKKARMEAWAWKAGLPLRRGIGNIRHWKHPAFTGLMASCEELSRTITSGSRHDVVLIHICALLRVLHRATMLLQQPLLLLLGVIS